MLIPIQSSSSSCPEYAMVELQGSLEIQEAAKQRMLGLTIGELTATPDGLTLLIGYHELHGKEVPLKSPLVVLRKQAAADRGDDTSQPQQQSHDTEIGGQPSLLYVVEGVIRRKYIFKSRPKALISNQESKPKKMKPSVDNVAKIGGG